MTNGLENLGSLFFFSVVFSNIYAHVHLEYCFFHLKMSIERSSLVFLSENVLCKETRSLKFTCYLVIRYYA